MVPAAAEGAAGSGTAGGVIGQTSPKEPKGWISRGVIEELNIQKGDCADASEYKSYNLIS